jgi:hypothetical protein
MARNDEPNGAPKFVGSAEPIESVTAYTPWKKSLVVTLGTTGCQFAENLVYLCPETAETIVGIDSAAPTSGEEEGGAPPWLIELKPQDLRALVHSPLPFFAHERWRELEHPRRVDHGGGAARAIGAALAAPELGRIRQRTRQCLVQVLNDPPLSGIVPVLIVAGGAGGTGSSLVSIVAYLVHQEARMMAPGIETRVEVMLILEPYYHAIGFQGPEREARRLPANVAQTLREILWLQTPSNGTGLQRALAIGNPITRPPVSALLPFGCDATGAALTSERLFSRMVAVGIARNHPGVAELDRNLLCNGGIRGTEQEILTADATAIAWLPPAVGELYVLAKQEQAIAAALVLPETERIEGWKDNVKSLLGVDGIKGDIDRTLDELVPAAKTGVDPLIGKRSDRGVVDHLLAIHRYHKAHCIPQYFAKAHAKDEQNQRQVIPEAVDATVEAILAQTASLPTARAVVKALISDLREQAANVRARLDGIKAANHLGSLNEHLAELQKNRFRLRKAPLRVAAGQACEAWKWSEKEVLALNLQGLALKATIHRLQIVRARMASHEAELREWQAVERTRRERYFRAATAQSDAISSVVAADELDAFMDKLDRGIDDKLGVLPSPLLPAQLIASGLRALIDEFDRSNRSRYATFVRHELKSLSGVVAYGRLHFAVAPWAAAAAARISTPVALNFLPIGGEANATRHRFIAAPADEHAILKKAQTAIPALRPYQVLENAGDPFTVVIRDRYALLPVRTLAAAPDYEIAVAELEREDQSKVVNVLWHCPEVEPARSIRLAYTYQVPVNGAPASPIQRGNPIVLNDGHSAEPLSVSG